MSNEYIPNHELPIEVAQAQERARRKSEREAEAREARHKADRKAKEAEERREAQERAALRAKFEAEREAERVAAEAEAKERARKEYPYSAESFEDAWPGIRAALAAAEIQRQRERIAHPRDYLNSYASTSTQPVNPTTDITTEGTE